jgi:hypothetical protein
MPVAAHIAPALLWALLTAAAPPPTLAGSPAARAPLAVVVVGADPAARDEAPRLQGLAEAAAGQSERFAPVDLVAALDPERESFRTRRARDGEAALEEAARAYNDLDTQRAHDRAAAAIKAFQDTDLSRTFPRLIAARVLKAASRFANGEVKPARKELEQILALDPDAALPPEFFPPDVLSFARKTRAALQSSRGVRLEVKTIPAGAEIWVDGRRQGPSPVLVVGLAPGDHLVTARAPGYAVEQQVASGSVTLTLRAASLHARWAALQQAAADASALPSAAAALAREVGAAQALLAVASQAARPEAVAVEVTRLDARTAAPRARTRGTVPTGPGLSAAWSGLLSGALGADDASVALAAAAPPPLPASGPAGAAAPFQWRPAYTGYSLMVGSVALAAGGGFLGWQAAQQQRAFLATPQTDHVRSDALRASGQSYALMADVLFIAALAAAIPGGYFAFLAPQ